jgi:osmotically-inducible protein OsmY
MTTDSTIRDDVVEELDFDPQLDAQHIGVAVSKGVVTLTGHVSSLQQKHAALHATERVRGVKAVACEIEVRLPSAKKHNDDEIAQRALRILDWTLPETVQVKVAVNHGYVTLTGETDWRFQKEDAEKAVLKLGGVSGVINNLSVRPRINASDIQTSIQRALTRDALLESASIVAGVEGTGVILTGEVKTARERATAEEAVWRVPGVSDVTNNIRIR